MKTIESAVAAYLVPGQCDVSSSYGGNLKALWDEFGRENVEKEIERQELPKIRKDDVHVGLKMKSILKGTPCKITGYKVTDDGIRWKVSYGDFSRYWSLTHIHKYYVKD